jgi:hypothetical protein
LFGCSTPGSLKTQINTTKNIVVPAPHDFQSPAKAIELFAAVKKEKQDKDVRNFALNSLKALINQQKKVSEELSATNRLLLQPGHSYKFTLESFCVNAGVERPVIGDGLFLGALEGAPKGWLPKILSEYKAKKISQNATQVLIWSLLSGAKFDELSSESQKDLTKIFPDARVRFGNSVAQAKVQDFLFGQIPEEVLDAKNKANEYKDLIQDSTASFEQIEKIFSPESSRQKPIPVGWLKSQEGYFIHLMSDGYQRVKVKIYVPEDLKPGTYFEPTQGVALPGQGQRLALSNQVVEETSQYLQNDFKNTTGITASEGAFILKHPLDAWKINELAAKAIKTTQEKFEAANFHNDQADAFRHFVWSGAITHEMGSEKARTYLDAHEDYPANPIAEKRMDLNNNQAGIEFAKNYHRNDFEKDLVNEGLRKIRNRELVWFE